MLSPRFKCSPFGVSVLSDVELERTGSAAGSGPLRLTIRPGLARSKTIDGARLWSWPAIRPALEVYSTPRGLLFRYREQADILYDRGALTLDVIPEANLPFRNLSQLLLGQVIPMIAADRGSLVLHAAGAVLSGGSLIGLLGPSGTGKSTLLAALIDHGFLAFSDDYLALDRQDGILTVHPGPRNIRLWPDSLKLIASQRTSSFVQLSNGKYQIHPPDEHWSTSLEPPKIFYALAPSDDPDRRVTIKRLTSHAAAAELFRNALLVRKRDRPTTSRVFSQIADVVEQAVVYRIEYPKGATGLREAAMRIRDCSLHA